jgi:putative transcriptional regulator
MNKLQELRKAKGLTQKQVAKEWEVTPDYVSMLERGDRTPGFLLSRRIANFYNTSVDAIFFKEAENKVFDNQNTKGGQ